MSRGAYITPRDFVTRDNVVGRPHGRTTSLAPQAPFTDEQSESYVGTPRGDWKLFGAAGAVSEARRRRKIFLNFGDFHIVTREFE